MLLVYRLMSSNIACQYASSRAVSVLGAYFTGLSEAIALSVAHAAVNKLTGQSCTGLGQRLVRHACLLST